VLLARREREDETAVAVLVCRLSSQAARQLNGRTSSRVARTPQYGPPKPSGTEDWASIATISASAGGLTDPREIASAIETTSIAPLL